MSYGSFKKCYLQIIHLKIIIYVESGFGIKQPSRDDVLLNQITFVGNRCQGQPKGSLSLATTLRYKGGCCSYPWIAPLYLWAVPYYAEC